MSYVIQREYDLIAGHRLQNHQGRCKRLHGHNYKLRVSLSAERLNRDGMVLDFAYIDDTANQLLKQWDHSMLLESDDPFIDIISSAGRLEESGIYIFYCAPTAENIAKLFFEHMHRYLPNQVLAGISVSGVSCEEAPGCWAHYVP